MSRTSGRVRAALAAVTVAGLAAGLALATTGAADARARPEFGSGEVGFNADPLHDSANLHAYVPGKTPFVRFVMNWWKVQDRPDSTPNWTEVDAKVDAAVAQGVRPLIVIAYAPPWASGDHDTGDPAHDQTWLPTDTDAWTSIVERLAARYAGRVQAYEVWNEPNLERFGKFDGGPVAAMKQYWTLTGLAHRAVHAHCDDCVVVAGGSAADPDPERSSSRWLEWAYQNGLGDTFDAVAMHPYPPYDREPDASDCGADFINGFGPPDEVTACGELARVHRVMARHGDTAKRIWATEWGYPLAIWGTEGVAAASARLVKSVRMWRALPYAGPLFLYSFRDCPYDTDDCKWGVLTRDGVRRDPAYTALSDALRFAGHGPLQIPALAATLPAAPPGARHTAVDWDADGRPDLARITATRATILSGATNFQRALLDTAIALPVAGAAFDVAFADWNGDRRLDLFAVKKSATGTRTVEVHILSGAADLSRFLFQKGTGQPLIAADFDFDLGDWDRDGRPDLVGVKRSATGTGRIEAHILSGASNFDRFVIQIGTAQSGIDAPQRYVVTDWNADGRMDLAGLKTGATGTGTVEAHVLSGASNFQSFLIQTGTGQPRADAPLDVAFVDWDRADRPDLLVVSPTGDRVTILKG